MLIEHDLRGASILAADDDPSNLKVLESMLQELGCEVRLARDGEMLLQSVALKLPDLILLDVHMPGIDGYQACERLKSSDKSKDIPVIFLSAMNEQFSKVKAFELGAVDYITKPFQLEELKARIGVHLKLAHQARELRNLQAAVEQSRTSIFTTDLDGYIQYANQSTAEVSGYPMLEIIGERPSLFKSGEHQNEFYAELWQTISSGNVWRGELCNKKKNGELYWVLAVISPVRGTEGAFTRYVAIEEDVTEQRKLREQLIKAKEQAESANKAKSSFLAMMSHEIRTPMNGVVGIIDLLNQTNLDREQVRLAHIAKMSSMSLLNIINDILDFSKIEAGRMKLESIPVAWRSVIDGAAEMVSGELKSRDLRLYCLVDPAVPERVHGDQERLRQLLLNLLSNAIKFTESTGEKEGVIVIRLNFKADSLRQLVLEVEDNGIGISPEQLKTLFQPFVQADSSTHRRYGGTGLGLSICVRLIGMMGGEISCVSEEGSGSRFIVNLPCEQVAYLPDTELLLDGCNLLLDSTDLNLKDFLADDLSALGARVIFADDLPENVEDPEQAIELVLITDYRSTDEKIVLVKKYQTRYPASRCVVLASAAEQMDKEKFPACVLVDANPFRPEELHKALAIATGRIASATEKEKLLIDPTRTIPEISQAESEGCLILIAEDNLVNQEVIKRQLNFLGYAAEVADDGEMALEMMKKRHYGLLLTDCHMPRIDGFQLTAAIRERELHGASRTPIVAITANAMQGEAERCLLAGMDGYLAKPVELAKLKESIDRWLPIEKCCTLSGCTEPEKPSESKSDIIDFELLARFLGDDKETQHYFLNKFANDSKDTFEAAKSAAEEEDMVKVVQLMHKLKSSSKAVGAENLSGLCLQLELVAKSRDVGKAAILTGDVLDEFSRVCSYVATLD
ncbi:response regulator [Vibrio sp. JC009]|uniref:response regulator n=1 Tax=Vibrio sp. JC009 TaxID=2912314 RepID=UPI0023B123B4|nr:response regulator [Vibrio sp. JC009]WED20795.1 response regulator [Vibrio sp. JC009]